MSLSTLEYLRHILLEASYLVQQAQGLTKTAFVTDETLRRAFVRSIEIIGEAAQHVPEDYRRAHPQVAWREMAGMRNRLIHDYMSVDYDIVWDVVVNEIPLLQKEVRQLIATLEASPDS